MARMSSTAAVTLGRIIMGLVTLFLLVDAGIDLFAPGMVSQQMAETGYPVALARPLGLVVLLCAVLYAVPRTAVLGAILVTGFLGGAIATHFRLGEIGSPPQLISVLVGVLTWAGLALVDPRLRALIAPTAPDAPGEPSVRPR